jgi:hypothetical protein
MSKILIHFSKAFQLDLQKAKETETGDVECLATAERLLHSLVFNINMNVGQQCNLVKNRQRDKPCQKQQQLQQRMHQHRIIKRQQTISNIGLCKISRQMKKAIASLGYASGANHSQVENTMFHRNLWFQYRKLV